MQLKIYVRDGTVSQDYTGSSAMLSRQVHAGRRVGNRATFAHTSPHFFAKLPSNAAQQTPKTWGEEWAKVALLLRTHRPVRVARAHDSITRAGRERSVGSKACT